MFIYFQSFSHGFSFLRLTNNFLNFSSHKYVFFNFINFAIIAYSFTLYFVGLFCPRTDHNVEKHRNIFPNVKLCILQIENTFNQYGVLQFQGLLTLKDRNKCRKIIGHIER